jgi:hypothetical protein
MSIVFSSPDPVMVAKGQHREGGCRVGGQHGDIPTYRIAETSKRPDSKTEAEPGRGQHF